MKIIVPSFGIRFMLPSFSLHKVPSPSHTPQSSNFFPESRTLSQPTFYRDESKCYNRSKFREKNSSRRKELAGFCIRYTNSQAVTDLHTSCHKGCRYQDVFALLFPSCCDKSGTSCYYLVTRLMTATDLLQAVRNKLLRT